MENLGNDVLENILFRLPSGTDSSQAKRVCKSWKSILTSRRLNEAGFLFACRYYKYGCKINKIKLYFGEEYDHIHINKMKRNYYYSCETLMEMEYCRFSFTSYQGNILVGSCNGLVCFKKDVSITGKAEPLAICNPLTGEFIILKPNLSRLRDGLPYLIANGFGYCQSTKQYKVVRIYSFNWQSSRVQVYTIGSNEWRDMETGINHIFSASGIFANGVLHWLNGLVINNHISVFDLEDEKFRALPLPPYEVLKNRLRVSNKLKFLGGNLCWVQRDGSSTDIWAYKRSNTGCSTEVYDQKRDYYSGNSWNWVKELSIERCGLYEPFGITKTNQVLLSGGNYTCWYDPTTRTVSNLGDDKTVMGSSSIHVIPHANSCVSLKDFGETWFGPGCSAVPQTKSSASSTKVRECLS